MMRIVRLISVMFAFLIFAAACTQSDGREEPSVTEVAQPTATAEPVQPTPTASEAEQLPAFVESLQTAVVDQDYATMQDLMTDPVAVAAWRSEGRVYTPAQVVAEFQNDALPAPTAVQFSGLTEEALTNLLGQPPASLFGPTSTVVATLHSTGWGVDGNDEAILFVSEEDGRFAWFAFLYTFGSFDQSSDSGSSDLFPFVETDVNFVQAQQDVVMYSGPGDTYDTIGGIADGQTALVTGQSEDGAWWRVICPDDSIGDCWVTANPDVTLPLNGGDSQAEPAGVIAAEPIFTGGDLQFVSWSPNGRYLAYFEYTEEQVAEASVEGLRGTYPGTFVLYDTQTGEKCTDYPLSGLFNYEGPGSGAQWRWLPDDQLMVILPDGQLLQTTAPCEPGENVAGQFSSPISAIGSLSPNEEWLILAGGGQYWLYSLSTQNAHVIADVETDPFNNLIWSPDSQHVSVTLAGNYDGNRSPVGGTRVVDVATGEIIAQHDWEPANALDGTFGGPVWISNEAFVVTLTLDQGPFMMDVDGNMQPLLPTLFDETFDPGNYWPPLDVYADVENGRYAILRGNEGRDTAAKLYTYTPDGETVEVLEEIVQTLRIFPVGTLGYDENGRYWTRPLFEVGQPFVEQPAMANPWQATENRLLVAADAGVITIYDREVEGVTERLQVEAFATGFNLNPLLSPNEQWLAIFVTQPQDGLGKALIVVPVAAGQ